jgi:hypothetical protein
MPGVARSVRTVTTVISDPPRRGRFGRLGLPVTPLWGPTGRREPNGEAQPGHPAAARGVRTRHRTARARADDRRIAVEVGIGIGQRAARDRWAAWGTVTPHLQQAEAPGHRHHKMP